MFQIQNVLMATALLLMASFSNAEIYKWVDAQGKVHFGDAPVSAQAAAIDVKEANSLPSTSVREARKSLDTNNKSARNVAYSKSNKERCNKLTKKYKQQSVLSGFSCS